MTRAFAILIAAFFTFSAQAQEMASANIVCGPPGSMIAKALQLYGAKPSQAGVSIGGEALGILVINEETGSWAWIVAFPNDGHECVFANGEGWGALSPQKKGSL